MAGRVIIISGPPGSGKTSVAGVLAAEAERAVHLESDWFYRWIVSGFIPPFQPASKQQNHVVMQAVIDTAATYAGGGFDVFWDGVVGPWWMDLVEAGLARRDLPFTYVVLRPSKQSALDRVRAREASGKRREPDAREETATTGAAVMHDQFADLGDHERFVVNSDGALVDVVETVRRALVDPRFTYNPS